MASPVVLLVSSVAEQREACAALLLQAGYCVLHACNAVEAVKRSLCDGPSLILSDLQLPDVDGLELFDFLYHHPRTVDTPVVAIIDNSAQCAPGVLALGFAAYLVKADAPSHLIPLVQNMIGPPIGGSPPLNRTFAPPGKQRYCGTDGATQCCAIRTQTAPPLSTLMSMHLLVRRRPHPVRDLETAMTNRRLVCDRRGYCGPFFNKDYYSAFPDPLWKGMAECLLCRSTVHMETERSKRESHAPAFSVQVPACSVECGPGLAV